MTQTSISILQLLHPPTPSPTHQPSQNHLPTTKQIPTHSFSVRTGRISCFTQPFKNQCWNPGHESSCQTQNQRQPLSRCLQGWQAKLLHHTATDSLAYAPASTALSSPWNAARNERMLLNMLGSATLAGGIAAGLLGFSASAKTDDKQVCSKVIELLDNREGYPEHIFSVCTGISVTLEPCMYVPAVCRPYIQHGRLRESVNMVREGDILAQLLVWMHAHHELQM